MPKKMRKADIYADEVASGMSVREVAAKHGVSRSAVYAATSIRGVECFTPLSAEVCVYPNLRNWMNENRVSKKELVHRMGNVYCGKAITNVNDWLSGRAYPSKKVIDAFIAVTGLTYEQLWSMGADEPKTNGDWIRGMDDKELAAFLGKVDICGRIQGSGPFCDDRAVCEGCIEAWLDQPAEEEV